MAMEMARSEVLKIWVEQCVPLCESADGES